jgi:hypothetical protein
MYYSNSLVHHKNWHITTAPEKSATKEFIMRIQSTTILLIALVSSPLFAASLTDAEKEQISAANNPSVEEVKRVVPQDFFPVIMFYGDACLLRTSADVLKDSWGGRREKLYHQLARWYINAVIPSNVRLENSDFALASKYGLRVIHQNNMLYTVPQDELASGVSEQMAEVKKSWEEDIARIKDLPNLLAYQVYDEPLPDHCTAIALLMDYVRSLDPTRAALYTQQNMPVGESRAEWTALSKAHVILSDQYNVCGAFGRNPWTYRESIAEFSKPNKNAIHWPIIQAFSYYMDPSMPDFRIMAWNAVAAGAKGLGLYITGAANFSWPAPKGGGYPSLGSVCFSEDIFSTEVARLARLLATAGEHLVPLEYSTDFAWSAVKSEKINTAFYIGDKNPNYPAGKIRPAIEVAAFTGKAYDILVIHSNDPNLVREDVVKLPDSASRNLLVDLRTLAPVPKKDGGYLLEFDRGDGSLFAYGTEESVAPVIEKVQRNRFVADARLLRLDMATAKLYGIDIAQPEAILQEAETAPAAELEKAIQRAAAAFYAAEMANADYTAMTTALEAARNAYGLVDRRLRRIPKHFSTPVDQLPEKTQKHINDAVSFAIRFTEVENLYLAGKCTTALANELNQQCKLILSEDFAL